MYTVALKDGAIGDYGAHGDSVEIVHFSRFWSIALHPYRNDANVEYPISSDRCASAADLYTPADVAGAHALRRLLRCGTVWTVSVVAGHCGHAERTVARPVHRPRFIYHCACQFLVVGVTSGFVRARPASFWLLLLIS